MPGAVKHAIQNTLRRLGYVLVRKERYVDRDALYQSDGLTTCHDTDFLDSPRFAAAYARGLRAANGCDPGHHWRVLTALWAARQALAAAGDFVECGVNAGFISSAIAHDLDFSSLDRRFFLLDTFTGPPADQFLPSEHASGLVAQVDDARGRGAYVTDLERVRANFAEWPNVVVVPGRVPEVLFGMPAEQVAFLHLDLNAAAPEREALKYIWPRMPAGAVVLLDDYAFFGYRAQKDAIDDLSRELGFDILRLPTGQGLIIKTAGA